MTDTMQPTIDLYLCKQLIRNMGAIISNSLRNFWLSRQDATDAMNACFDILAEILKGTDRIEFKLLNSQFTANGVKIEDTSANINFLINHLNDLEVQNFNLTKEAGPDDFVKFLEIMEARASEIEQLGGFVCFLSHCGIKGITSRKVIIKEIAEEDVVVNKKDMEAIGDGSGTHVANIIAFLKGDGNSAQGESQKAVVDASSNPEQMASLILQSAQIQQAENPLEGGETLVDFVVGSLRKTFTVIQSSKASHTKTGRKRITKNLLLLEEDIIKRMREMSDEWSEDDLEEITRSIEEMTDEIKIDSLADEYISQRKTIEKNEAQILDFMKSRGIENVEDIALKSRLLEKGLSIQGWNELVIKSSSGGAAPGDSSGKGEGGTGPGGNAAVASFGLIGGGSGSGLGGLMEAITHLDVLLDSMEKQFDASDEQMRNEHVDEIMKVFSDVNKQVDVLVMKVEHSVESLIEEVQSDSQSVETAEEHVRDAGTTLRKTRRQILTSVAGIIRNISEPLSMINTSLEMIQSRTFGNVNTNQSSIIQVAKRNADRIKNVLDRLASLGSDSSV